MKQLIEKETLEKFRDYLIKEERSGATVEKYLHDTGEFAAWLGVRELSKETVSAWKETLLVRGLQPGTVNGKLAALSSLLRLLGREDCRVKALKVQRRVFRDQSRELIRAEYDRLIRAAEESGQERLALLMETICATGLRVSEVQYITAEAVDRGEAVIDLKGKIRTILLPGKLRKKLLGYAKRRRIRAGAIFRTRNGTPMSRRQIWSEMKRVCEKAGVEPGKVFPHNLRHLFAVTFYRICRDIVKLADVLGHSSVETTRIYLIASGAEHRRQLDRLGLVS